VRNCAIIEPWGYYERAREMTDMLFDTQKVVDRLVEAGVPPTQARAHAAVLVDVIGSIDGHVIERYATKDAVARAVDKFEAGMAKLRSDLMKWVLVVGVSLSFLQTAFISALILKLLP
jgi:hypothetical protein